MANIIVAKEEYKNLEYTVKMFDPNDNHGVAKGKFYVTTNQAVQTNKNYDTYGEAVADTHLAIDKWRVQKPEDLNGWIDLIEKCIEWTGYVDYELNRKEVAIILQRFAKLRHTIGTGTIN